MAKTRNFRDLDLPVSALYKLASPSTPEAVRSEVLDRAESGERLSHKQVAATITQAKAAAVPAAQERTKPLSAAEELAAIDASDMSDTEKARAFYHMIEQGERMMADATQQLAQLAEDLGSDENEQASEDDDKEPICGFCTRHGCHHNQLIASENILGEIVFLCELCVRGFADCSRAAP
jgi:hypothetical protein